jgi:hypothetical protein
MRNIFPIMIVTATLLVGCHSLSTVHAPTTSGTNAVVSTNTPTGTNATVVAGASPPATVHVNTPSETLSENIALGDLGAAFLFLLPVILGLKRS